MSDDAWHSVPLSHLGNPAGLPVVKSQNLAVGKKSLGTWPSWSEKWIRGRMVYSQYE